VKVDTRLVSQKGIEPFARSTRNGSSVGSAPSTIRPPGDDEIAGEVAISMFSFRKTGAGART
jgi:hypothetical protein